jgi:peptidyl-prolyl cis-trans isomerase SurA
MVLASGTAQAEHRVVERVAAVVNDQVILESELHARMLPLLPSVEQIPDPAERTRRTATLTNKMLDEMINDEVLLQAARGAKIVVEDTEVEAVIEDVMERYHITRKQLDEEMKKQGMGSDFYRNSLLRHRAINQVLGPKLTVTDADVQARYDEMARLAQGVGKVQLAHIVIDVPDHATEQQLDDLRTKALATLDRARREDFATLAAAVSDDQATKARGGELGWRDIDTIEPGWEAVFNMAKGDVKGPLKSARGFHILKVLDVQRSQIEPYSVLQPKLLDELRKKQLVKLAEAWVGELRKKAYVDIKLH